MIKTCYGVHSAGGVSFLHQTKGSLAQTAVPLPGVESPYSCKPQGHCPHLIQLDQAGELVPELADPLAAFLAPHPAPRRSSIVSCAGLGGVLDILMQMSSPKNGGTRSVTRVMQNETKLTNVMPLIIWGVNLETLYQAQTFLKMTDGHPRPVLVVLERFLPITLPLIETQLTPDVIGHHDWRAIGARVLSDAMMSGTL